MEIRKGAALAAAVAGLLAASGCGSNDTVDVGKSEQGLKCQGANACKGMSECASPMGKNDCQGMNECKGMGWITVDTAKDCEMLGGTVIES